MPDLACLYDRYAEDCVRSAEKIDNPGHRTMLLKAAAEWREAAQKLRQMQQPLTAEEQPNRRRLNAQPHACMKRPKG